MKIIVMQISSGLTSTGVPVYTDGQSLDSISPGGSISASVDVPAYCLLMEYGVHRREPALEQSAVLQVS